MSRFNIVMRHISPRKREQLKEMIQYKADVSTKMLRYIGSGLHDGLQPHYWMDKAEERRLSRHRLEASETEAEVERPPCVRVDLLFVDDCCWDISVPYAMEMLEKWVLLAIKYDFHLINPELMMYAEERLKQMKRFGDPESGRGWVTPEGEVPLGCLPIWDLEYMEQTTIRNQNGVLVWAWPFKIQKYFHNMFEGHYEQWAAKKIQCAFRDYIYRDHVIVD